MSYIKQNFTKGQTLKADHLNHIELGIEALDSEISTMKENMNQNPGSGSLAVTSDDNGNVVLGFV